METQEHEIGSADIARSWIQSSLTGVAQESFLRFLSRFPNLTFYRESQAFLNWLEESENIRLPQWFRSIRTAIAYIVPRQAEVLFGNFDDEDLEDLFDGNWYTIELGYIEAQREILQSMEELLPFPVGGSLDNPDSVLVISLTDEMDQQVYEYSVESLWDNLDEGEPLLSTFGIVFDSYAEMFEHIVAIRIRDQEGGIEVIQAQDFLEEL